MRERASARLLVINPEQRVLLFHFVHHSGALAGTSCWATPGGGVEADETFAEAARRELWEETGIQVADVGPSVFEQTQQMTLPSGEQVRAVEQFFLVRVGHTQLSKVNWTDQEAEVLAAHHWWSNQELRQTEDIVWPEQLPALLERLGIFNH